MGNASNQHLPITQSINVKSDERKYYRSIGRIKDCKKGTKKVIVLFAKKNKCRIV